MTTQPKKGSEKTSVPRGPPIERDGSDRAATWDQVVPRDPKNSWSVSPTQAESPRETDRSRKGLSLKERHPQSSASLLPPPVPLPLPELKDQKGVQFQSTCNLCRESHKTQVWLCFLVLSFLSTSTCAAPVPGTADVKICLEKLTPTIKKSDAMLYAPSTTKANCKIMALKCYMLELIMVMNEEEIVDNKAGCIMDFNETVHLEANSVGCPPCEAYSLKNITTFLKELNHLLEEMTTRSNT